MMRRLLVCFTTLLPAVLAQDVEKGAQIFRTTCAQGYCHGSGGTQGRAPKLLGRAYDGLAAAKIVKEGVANTGMPGFASRLSAAELDAVVAYVVKISGGDMSTLKSSAAGGASAMPDAAQRGKALFFDASRGVHRCGTCHAVGGMGTAVGPNLGATSMHSVSLARQGKPAMVRLATLRQSNEKWPALVVEQSAGIVRAFDLSAMPPVLRTLDKGSVSFSAGSPWRHSNAVKNYTDAELANVVAYLQWAARQ